MQLKQDNVRTKTAVIIGAGPAGLSAAAKLIELSDEWHVIILEASEFIGGISRTMRHNGCRLDIGGHRFFSKSQEVNAFWNRLMPIQGHPAWDDALLGRPCHLEPGGPDPERTNRVMLRRRRISRIYYLRRFFNYPVSLSTIFAMGAVRTVRAGLSYMYAAFVKRPEQSLEDFYVNRFGRILYSMFFEGYTEKLWGVHPSKISPEWGRQRVKGLSLWKTLIHLFGRQGSNRETSLIEEFLYPKYGPGQLWEVLADDLRLKGIEIRLKSEVTNFSCKDGRIIGVGVGDTTIACDAVFSSMAVKDLVAALPNVPSDVASISDELPYRDFITVGLKVNRLSINNKTSLQTVNKLIPDTWIYVQDRGVRLGRIQVFNNWSPYMVDDPSRHVWIGLEYFCSEGDRLWTMSNDAFIEMAIGELRGIGLISEDTTILDSVRLQVKKAYPAYFGSYAHFDLVRKFLDGHENLYCIGRNGQHRYNNMDHSMLCGFEAARALVTGSSKASLWDINTEKEYHEER